MRNGARASDSSDGRHPSEEIGAVFDGIRAKSCSGGMMNARQLVGASSNKRACGTVELSVVAPMRDEAPTLERFFSRLIPVLERLGLS